MNGKNQILEICQISGRRRIKIVLHEIYADNSQYNENGITWLEQFTRDNADTIKGMPLCAEFVDNDKDIPYGHGLTGLKGNIPVFENSVQVGTFEDWMIENIDFDGEKHKCLCGIGYINVIGLISRLQKEIKFLDQLKPRVHRKITERLFIRTDGKKKGVCQ